MRANRLDRASVELLCEYVQGLLEEDHPVPSHTIGAMNRLKQELDHNGRSRHFSGLVRVKVYEHHPDGSRRELKNSYRSEESENELSTIVEWP